MLKSIVYTALAALLSFTSCTRDAYDEGTGTFSLTQADFVEAHANGSKQLDYVLTDDGDSLNMTSAQSISWMQQKDTLYRALLYYNKVGTNEAEQVALSYVYTLQARPTKSYKSVTTDSADFESAWVSKNRRYLNFGLLFKAGYTDKDVTGQSIGLACDSIHQNTDGTKTAYYLFLHEQNGVPEYFTVKSYISVPMSSIVADSVVFTIHTYKNGVLRKRISLRD